MWVGVERAQKIVINFKLGGFPGALVFFSAANSIVIVIVVAPLGPAVKWAKNDEVKKKLKLKLHAIKHEVCKLTSLQILDRKYVRFPAWPSCC